MDKFYRKTIYNDFDKDKDLLFGAIEWWGGDEGYNLEDIEDAEDRRYNKKYMIRCFGSTERGESVSLKIKNFNPFFYIKMEDDFNKMHLKRFINYIKQHYILKKKNEDGFYKEYYSDCLLEKECEIIIRKDIYGFQNNREYKFVKLVFNSIVALNKTKYIFKKPVMIPNIGRSSLKEKKYDLYEINFEPFMKFCHLKDIKMSGWLRVNKSDYKLTRDSKTCISAETDWHSVVSEKEINNIPNFLQCSWDIETYSFDRTFPIPNKEFNGEYPNVIYQIASAFKYSKDSDFLIKHALTLKRCAPINDTSVIVEECVDEMELITKWISLIENMDPDILYTYNGDSFDCMYIYERSKLYGLDIKLLRVLSRLKNTSSIVKKETFSSSAYGDSDYLRFYIPGRLNYDLLIHYKRGMKKYPSYKLDYIANEILKEGKHEVSAKEIFDYYDSGDPEKIKVILLYCIQDTALLQKLVDKQLILLTILQLSNVTFIPLGFLNSRGQTIKVYSQVLRKANQMGFLVPNTIFNTDSVPLVIETKTSHNLGLSEIGRYIEINLGYSKSSGRSIIINGKIKEYLSETSILIYTDTELENTYHNLYCKLGNKNIFATKLYSNDDLLDDSFTGAKVLEAVPGLYTDNIAVLDFASLYPTIEISRNLCFSTIVMNEKYLNCEGVKYETIKWDDKVDIKFNHKCSAEMKSGKRKGVECGKNAFFEIDGKYFCRVHDPMKNEREESVQKRDITYEYTIVQCENSKNKGVIPALLEDLYSERKKVKKLMAKAYEDSNKLLEDIYNSTQLAIKVSLNSVYGFVSRNGGNLAYKPLGQLTTAIGRMLIEQSKNYAENEFVNYIKSNKLNVYKLGTIEIKESESEMQQILNKFIS